MTPEEKKDWKPEKFPQPRTFPAEWNMSGLIADKDANAQEDDNGGYKPEKFPQPRAFPENWHSDDRH